MDDGRRIGARSPGGRVSRSPGGGDRGSIRRGSDRPGASGRV